MFTQEAFNNYQEDILRAYATFKGLFKLWQIVYSSGTIF